MFKSISFVFLALLLVHTSFSQEYFVSNTIIKTPVTYNNLPEDGYGQKIYNLLGLENNISVHAIKLDAKSRLLLRISRDNNDKLTAKISLTQVEITGNTNLHDFSIDTLLWPSGFTASLTLYNGKHKRGTISFYASANGKLNTIDLSKVINSNIGDVSASITDIQFNYKKNSYLQIQSISRTIGYYYSYGLLLNNLLNTYSQNVKDYDPSAEHIFLDKILIDRVVNNVANNKFTLKLNLEDSDPIGFLKLYRKLQRLSNRDETLFNQQLQSTKSNIINPVEFCELYCAISTNYLSLAKTLQPSNASGFEEIAKVEATHDAKNNLKEIITYYNKESGIIQLDLFQNIFNNYVNLAEIANYSDNYTGALLLLNNSLQIHNWYNTHLTDKYNILVSSALDGIASSYLRVGDVALRAQNNSLANKYFNKADEIVMSNTDIFESIKHSDTAFNNYLELQYKIALNFIEYKKFTEAVKRLSYGNKICLRVNNTTYCNLIDSATCLAHSGIANIKLDSLEGLITIGQFPDAYEQLQGISIYIDNNGCENKDDSLRFSELAYSLFIEYLQRGEILLDAQQTEMALHNLLRAKSIEENYLFSAFKKLDILIKFAAEPEITKLIDEAKYHTWANRIDEALFLSLKAKKLNKLYFGEANIIINKYLAELDEQMKSRKCVSYKIKYDDAIKKIHIAIKYNNYNKLNNLLNEAQSYVIDYPDCNIQNTEVIEIRNKYYTIIDFYNQYDIVTIKLFEEGYDDAIEKYVELSAFYAKNNLEKYSINFADIKAFIIAQNLPRLTMETAKHYVNINNSDMGFDFVKIYKKQGGDSKSIKNITNKIAAKFASRDKELNKSSKEALQEYTNNENWYNSFRLAYLKNRLGVVNNN